MMKFTKKEIVEGVLFGLVFWFMLHGVWYVIYFANKLVGG